MKFRKIQKPLFLKNGDFHKFGILYEWPVVLFKLIKLKVKILVSNNLLMLLKNFKQSFDKDTSIIMSI